MLLRTTCALLAFFAVGVSLGYVSLRPSRAVMDKYYAPPSIDVLQQTIALTGIVRSVGAHSLSTVVADPLGTVRQVDVEFDSHTTINSLNGPTDGIRPGAGVYMRIRNTPGTLYAVGINYTNTPP